MLSVIMLIAIMLSVSAPTLLQKHKMGKMKYMYKGKGIGIGDRALSHLLKEHG
jgi:hypothetical protein